MLTRLRKDDACPRFRLVGVPLLFAMLAALLLPTAVSAAPETDTAADRQSQAFSLLEAAPVPVTGATADGVPLNGQFKFKKFTERRGVIYAVGKLQGALGTQLVNEKVKLPVTGASNPAPPAPAPAGAVGESAAIPQQATPGACDILTLVLGPLDLDLLGLRVFLDEVNLLIEAIPGAGNLLGNLLCGVAGLLDPATGGGLGGLLSGLLDAISNLLNGLLGGVGGA